MGCQQSSPAASAAAAPSRTNVKGVGQTERMVSRAHRVQQKLQAANANANNAGSTSNGSSVNSNINNSAPPKLDPSGHLMPEEVVRRTQCSIFSKKVTLGTLEHPILMEYAHWTQRGYYPDDPHKENQDESSLTESFAGAELDAMFAVYDGHGTQGHSCARFAKQQLPKNLAKYVRQARVKKYQKHLKQHGIKGVKTFDPKQWPFLDTEEYKACCRKAFSDSNENMHAATKVDDKLSGTTAISVNFHGNLITVCNVGDSRAVLGHFTNGDKNENKSSSDANNEEEEKTEVVNSALEQGDDNDTTAIKRKVFPRNGNILAIPLSRDQTPYRRDERERIKNEGAAIMSIDQMEGIEEMHENWGDMVLGEDVDEHGDPPRVWLQGKDYPGTAFTRSLGDRLAEDVGVTAEPEILARELTLNDHLLVIASDGIFEFLTNQEVVDMCIESESPLVACEKLVKAAYDKWLIYERRTDDITVIVCFLDVDNAPPQNGEKGTTEDLLELASSVYGNKPMKKLLSRPRGGSMAKGADED